MQASEDRKRNDSSDEARPTMDRCILLQGQVRTRVVVIMGIRAKDAAQVLCAECHQVVHALATDRANQPFGEAVLPGRTGRDWSVAYTHGGEPLADDVPRRRRHGRGAGSVAPPARERRR
jgi:hypothetical protein